MREILWVKNSAENFEGGTMAAAISWAATTGCSRGNSPSPTRTPTWSTPRFEMALASPGLETSYTCVSTTSPAETQRHHQILHRCLRSQRWLGADQGLAHVCSAPHAARTKSLRWRTLQRGELAFRASQRHLA